MKQLISILLVCVLLSCSAAAQYTGEDDSLQSCTLDIAIDGTYPGPGTYTDILTFYAQVG